MPYNTRNNPTTDTSPRTDTTPLPAAWIWGLCPSPMPPASATTVRVADNDRLGDIIGVERELVLTCHCTRQRVVGLAALTLVPGIEARLTVGALRQRLRCVVCGSAGTAGQVALRSWRSLAHTSGLEA